MQYVRKPTHQTHAARGAGVACCHLNAHVPSEVKRILLIKSIWFKHLHKDTTL